jgi:hypothetical protein
MKTHAKLSASGSVRWIHCAGSVKAEEGLPDTRSIFADEGSATHELAEICAVNGESPFDWVGRQLIEYNAITVTQEMAEGVQFYLDYVGQFYTPQTERYTEKRLDFSEWVPDGYGTADTIIYGNGTVDVFDLKYGKNIVSAQGNTQGILYMLGAIEDELVETHTFRFYIVQPRLDHIDTYTLTRSQLLELGEWVRERAALALSPDAERTPGEDQCKYCKAKATCPALNKLTEDVLMTDLDSMNTTNPDRLSQDQLQRAMAAKKLIVSWLDAVEDYITETIYTEDCDTFAGHKLVEGRSLRQWRNDSDAEKRLAALLGDDAFERKLLTVAKAEKALGKKRTAEISDLVEKPQGKPTLVPMDDPRPSFVKESADAFDSFDE